jgi:hypothetical protein
MVNSRPQEVRGKWGGINAGSGYRVAAIELARNNDAGQDRQ